jgi:glutaredoxin 3
MSIERLYSTTRRALMVGVLSLSVSGCVSGTAAHPGGAEPVSAELEAQMRRVPVAMYMTHWCPHCRRARAWLKDNGYSFVELDVERDPRAAAILQALNPRGSVPVFDVDGLVVIGFDPDMLHEAIRRAAQRRAGHGVASR